MTTLMDWPPDADEYLTPTLTTLVSALSVTPIETVSSKLSSSDEVSVESLSLPLKKVINLEYLLEKF